MVNFECSAVSQAKNTPTATGSDRTLVQTELSINDKRTSTVTWRLEEDISPPFGWAPRCLLCGV